MYNQLLQTIIHCTNVQSTVTYQYALYKFTQTQTGSHNWFRRLDIISAHSVTDQQLSRQHVKTHQATKRKLDIINLSFSKWLLSWTVKVSVGQICNVLLFITYLSCLESGSNSWWAYKRSVTIIMQRKKWSGRRWPCSCHLWVWPCLAGSGQRRSLSTALQGGHV